MSSGDVLTRTTQAICRRYIWWETPEQAIETPERVVAQVMNIGDWDDVLAVEAIVGVECFREVLRQAEIGQFNARSWHYWHYRLGLSTYGTVPSMPTRKIG
ncbi:MAG: hypothetical protein ACRDHN_00770 [Thermomicrobiales bacterium]